MIDSVACNLYLVVNIWVTIGDNLVLIVLLFPIVDTHFLVWQVCVSFHLPQLLLLYSMMKIPRLDAGVMRDFAQSVVENLVHMTPR